MDKLDILTSPLRFLKTFWLDPDLYVEKCLKGRRKTINTTSYTLGQNISNCWKNLWINPKSLAEVLPSFSFSLLADLSVASPVGEQWTVSARSPAGSFHRGGTNQEPVGKDYCSVCPVLDFWGWVFSVLCLELCVLCTASIFFALTVVSSFSVEPCWLSRSLDRNIPPCL